MAEAATKAGATLDCRPGIALHGIEQAEWIMRHDGAAAIPPKCR
jgi:hypothetical protein